MHRTLGLALAGGSVVALVVAFLRPDCRGPSYDLVCGPSLLALIITGIAALGATVALVGPRSRRGRRIQMAAAAGVVGSAAVFVAALFIFECRESGDVRMCGPHPVLQALWVPAFLLAAALVAAHVAVWLGEPPAPVNGTLARRPPG